MQRILSKLEHLLTVEPSEEETPEEPSIESAENSEPAAAEVAAYAKMVQPEPVPEQKLPVYHSAEIAGGNPDHFYDSESRMVLAGQLSRVIDAEGPIADSALFRKVTRAWGLARTGRRIEELLRSLVPARVIKTTEGKTTFYWPEFSQPAHWKDFRVADDANDSKRQLGEICLEELANLASFVLAEHGTTSVSELARTICRLQRIARTTSDSEMRIRKCLTNSCSGREFNINGDTVMLRN